MSRHILLEPHLTGDEFHDRYRRASDAVERSHWRLLWLLAKRHFATIEELDDVQATLCQPSSAPRSHPLYHRVPLAPQRIKERQGSRRQ